MIDNKFFPFTVLDFKRHIVCSIHHHSITMCPRQISGIWLISFDDIRSLSRNLCGNAKQRSFLIVVYFFSYFLKKANMITAIAAIIRMGTIRSIVSYIRFTSSLKSASHFKLFLTTGETIIQYDRLTPMSCCKSTFLFRVKGYSQSASLLAHNRIAAA